MAQFRIESYAVGASQSGTAEGSGYRWLVLTSVALAHGIRDRATVFFFATDPGSYFGTVFNVDQPNFQGRSVYAYSRETKFRDWYDILRGEQPLDFAYGYEGESGYDPSKPARILYYVQLTTGAPEPPGEGPADVSPGVP
jgi:hypothetical protein